MIHLGIKGATYTIGRPSGLVIPDTVDFSDAVRLPCGIHQGRKCIHSIFMGEFATKSVSCRGVDQRMVRFANKRPKTGLFHSLFAKRDHRHDYLRWGKRVKKQKAGDVAICDKKHPWIHESPCVSTRTSEMGARLVRPAPRLHRLVSLVNLREYSYLGHPPILGAP